jgi:hypothetical protein
MNAPCPPSPPFPPNQNWQWNGSRWVCTASIGTVVIVKVFNASAPYSPSPGLQSLTVETIGGGGGGGAVVSNALGGANGNTAGGGGSGSYSRKTLAAPMVAGGVNVAIGAGGAGASGPNGEGFGQNGQATTFGALCTSNGGTGGGSAGFGGNFSGGSGALPGVGDIAQLGCAGESGFAITPPTDFQLVIHGGSGGTVWGGSSPGFACGAGEMVDGNVGWPNTGAGGTGGAVFDSGNPASGGAGGTGICIVTEYCWVDALDDGCGCPPTGGGARVAITGSQWQGQGFDND